MELHTIAQLVDQYGIGVALTIVVSVIMVMLIKFVLKQWTVIMVSQQGILDQAAKERQGFQSIQDGYLSTLKDMAGEIRHKFKETGDAHRYQRDEHFKMMENMNTMCINIKLGQKTLENAVEGFKMSHISRGKESEIQIKALETLTKNCDETCKALVKMNGK
ncbi:hypothetical protein ACFL2J_06630 [Candidatus Omnitrophota bacterium]